MLIKALCDYYDMISNEGKVLPDGYSKVNINYMIVLNKGGSIADIVDVQERVSVTGKNGKSKEKIVPVVEMMPKRKGKTCIDANIIESRPLYIFGLEYDQKAGVFKAEAGSKASKSHLAFKDKQLNFLSNIENPSEVVLAYKQFVENWSPCDEIENHKLCEIASKYSSSGFEFGLASDSLIKLQDDKDVKEEWRREYLANKNETEEMVAQCAISGSKEAIARIHSKIKGIPGSLKSGAVLIGFNNQSEKSYGHEQSYNSNISETAMNKYTEALNYLISNKEHRTFFDEMTVIYFSLAKSADNDNMLGMLLNIGDNDEETKREEIDLLLKTMITNANDGVIKSSLEKRGIDPEAEYYVFGLKPNSSRVSLKFLSHNKYCKIIENVVQHQIDMQINEGTEQIPLWSIKKQLISPKSKNEKVNPALMAKVIEAALLKHEYPVSLLQTVVRRMKVDKGISADDLRIRAGIIKACILRYERRLNIKEDVIMSLDKNNDNPAYLCGRLFAVLEKLQRDAAGVKLNRTIKDSYFASACAKPATVFPRLSILSQNHVNKLKNDSSKVYYNRLLGEIYDKINGKYPEILPLIEQGKFIIGYYQQNQDLYKSKEKVD